MVKRTRGRKWMKIIERVRQRNPLCIMCEAQGDVRAFDHVDHIKPISKGGTDDMSNLRGLCIQHHDEVTRAGLGWKKAPHQVGLDGWPVGGG